MRKVRGKRSVLAGALALAALVLVQGCLSTPSAPTPAVIIKAVEGSLRAAAGDNLTFFLVVKNNRDSQDAFNVSVPGVPPGWNASLSNGTVELSPRGYKGLLLEVGVPSGTAPGAFQLKVKAVSSAKPSVSGTRTLKVTVLKPSADTVAEGRDIKVDYTGFLRTREVFDTSVRGIGNELAFPKAPQFNPPALNAYKPLPFKVGAGQMIKGFDRAVVGMQLGQSKTVAVEPRDGYGSFETIKIMLSEEFPMYTEMPRSNFTLTFGEEAAPNKVVVEPFYGWNVHVVDIVGDIVKLLRLPEVNQTCYPYGWEARVLDVNGSASGGLGNIVLRHYPVAGTNATYKGLPAEITALTPTAVELSHNVNVANPLAVQVLYFSIKVVSLS